MQDNEERIIELERAVADLDRTLKDLNQIVAEQSFKIDKMEKMIFYLAQNFDTSGAIKPLSEEVPPPHY